MPVPVLQVLPAGYVRSILTTAITAILRSYRLAVTTAAHSVLLRPAQCVTGGPFWNTHLPGLLWTYRLHHTTCYRCSLPLPTFYRRLRIYYPHYLPARYLPLHLPRSCCYRLLVPPFLPPWDVTHLPRDACR